jgi:hypothetical protein
MPPTELLNFSIQVLLILVLTMSIRRLYFTFSGLLEFVAWMESLAEAIPLALFSPLGWLPKVLSCRTCFTYWLTIFASLFIIFVAPRLHPACLWCVAMLSIPWCINHVLDVNLAKKLPPQQRPDNI